MKSNLKTTFFTLVLLTSSFARATDLLVCKSEFDPLPTTLRIYETKEGHAYELKTTISKTADFILAGRITRLFISETEQPAMAFESPEMDVKHLFGEYVVTNLRNRAITRFRDKNCTETAGNDVVGKGRGFEGFCAYANVAKQAAASNAANKCPSKKAYIIGKGDQMFGKEDLVCDRSENNPGTFVATALFRCVTE